MNDFQVDDINCPNCETQTHSRRCSDLFCEDGYIIDLHEEDAINYALGQVFEQCDLCYGSGFERWCPTCEWEWKGN